MKKMLFQRWRLMLCGDNYGFGLWLNAQEVSRSHLKNVPSEVARKAYDQWLEHQPQCGHKKCAKRQSPTRQLWQGNNSKYMWQAYHASFWTPQS